MKTIDRRQFLKQSAIGALALPLATGCRTTSATPHDLPALQVISQQPDLYHGWSTVTRRRNGDLLLVYSGGREAHVCPFGRVELMVSKDEGRSWREPRVLLDGPLDDRDAGVLETRNGTLLVTTFTSLAYEPILEHARLSGDWPTARIERWQRAQNRLAPDVRKAALGQWMIRSDDNGHTWSAPYASIVNSPHGPIELSDGRLLYAGKELWTGDQRVGFCESKDDGKSWQWLATLPVRDGDLMAEYHELHVVEAKSGRLIAHIRNHNPANHRETLQSESTDGGRTWSIPHSIGVWGLPSQLLRLRDDRLLMSYGYRRAPFGNQARLSTDEGATWSEPLTISGDGANHDLGYPSTVELTNGHLLTVWYEQLKGNPHAVLRQARWKIAS